jgi:rubrerythrin
MKRLDVKVPWDGSGASSAERLQAVIESHATGEEAHMASYRRLGTLSRDLVTAMLVDLVLEDEERHHGLLRRMAGRLRDDLELTRSKSSLPAGAPPDDTSATLLALTREYAEDERKGATTLRRLAKQASGLYGGVFSLLLETMARDSEKHERVMRFILRRLSDSRRDWPVTAARSVT